MEHAQATLEHAQAVGEKLIAAKKLAGHGRWESWVEANLPFSIDKAERMMRLHKNWERIKSARSRFWASRMPSRTWQPRRSRPGGTRPKARKTPGRIPPAGGQSILSARRAALPRRTTIRQVPDTVQATCPNSEWPEFDEDGICVWMAISKLCLITRPSPSPPMRS